jgi:hypothetical protein
MTQFRWQLRGAYGGNNTLTQRKLFISDKDRNGGVRLSLWTPAGETSPLILGFLGEREEATGVGRNGGRRRQLVRRRCGVDGEL